MARAGLLATLNCEFRQVRKEAAAAVNMCVEAGTVRATPFKNILSSQYLLRTIPHVL